MALPPAEAQVVAAAAAASAALLLMLMLQGAEGAGLSVPRHSAGAAVHQTAAAQQGVGEAARGAPVAARRD
eukprot:3937670-Rhodomonas_salina.2